MRPPQLVAGTGSMIPARPLLNRHTCAWCHRPRTVGSALPLTRPEV